MGLLRYSSNNSGGAFWLRLEEWQALEKAGWIVHWKHDENDPSHTHEKSGEEYFSLGLHDHSYKDELVQATWNGELWLGTPATSAVLVTDDPTSGVEQFEFVTCQSVDDQGCSCCGPPHSFQFEQDGNITWLESSPTSYSRSWW